MRVVAKNILADYIRQNPRRKGTILSWLKFMRAADCENHMRLEDEFPSAESAGGNRFIFTMRRLGSLRSEIPPGAFCGNKEYVARTIAKCQIAALVNFAAQAAIVEFAGTSSQYQKFAATKPARQAKNDGSDYDRAMGEIRTLMLKPTLEGAEIERLKSLAEFADKFEKTAFPLPQPEPEHLVKFIMDQNGWSRYDLPNIVAAANNSGQFYY